MCSYPEGTMNTSRFKCRHCRRMVSGGKPGQKYCGQKACQRARKRKWSREKYASDPDYRLNQKESTQAWLRSRGGAAQYYRDYRRRRRRLRIEMQQAAIGAEVSGIGEAAPKVARADSKQVSDRAKQRIATSVFAPDAAVFAARANRDAVSQYCSMEPGIYEILPVGANKDAAIVKIRMISSG